MKKLLDQARDNREKVLRVAREQSKPKGEEKETDVIKNINECRKYQS